MKDKAGSDPTVMISVRNAVGKSLDEHRNVEERVVCAHLADVK